jgi:hypothetical protein
VTREGVKKDQEATATEIERVKKQLAQEMASKNEAIRQRDQEEQGRLKAERERDQIKAEKDQEEQTRLKYIVQVERERNEAETAKAQAVIDVELTWEAERKQILEEKRIANMDLEWARKRIRELESAGYEAEARIEELIAERDRLKGLEEPKPK